MKISTPEKKMRSVECPLALEKNVAVQPLNDPTYASKDRTASIMTFKGDSTVFSSLLSLSLLSSLKMKCVGSQ